MHLAGKRVRLKRCLIDLGIRYEQPIALAIQGLIVLSIVTFSIETLPNLSQSAAAALATIEVATVMVFTLEYLVRLYTAPSRRRFVFSFFGVVDLLAFLPFYLSLGIDLRSLRAMRLMRLFRILKLARYSSATRRFHRALILAREEIVLFATLTLIMIYLSGVGIYYFENEAQPVVFASIFHSLWWAVVTLTTVGYGDAYPITVGGRVFTFLVLILGLGIISIPSGIVASALQQARQELRDEQREDRSTER